MDFGELCDIIQNLITRYSITESYGDNLDEVRIKIKAISHITLKYRAAR